MKILFVSACCRGGQSRTLRLARVLLAELRRLCPDAEVTVQDLYACPMQPMTMETLSVREALCSAQDWTHPITAHALAFQQADLVLIAAPYWDLSFPAALKIWVENMWVRSLTFVYRNDLPVGLCRARACAYVTTSGSMMGQLDFGTDYIRGVMQTLGIPAFMKVSAEGLDMAGADVEQRLAMGEKQARAAAAAMYSLASEQS